MTSNTYKAEDKTWIPCDSQVLPSGKPCNSFTSQQNLQGCTFMFISFCISKGIIHFLFLLWQNNFIQTSLRDAFPTALVFLHLGWPTSLFTWDQGRSFKLGFSVLKLRQSWGHYSSGGTWDSRLAMLNPGQTGHLMHMPHFLRWIYFIKEVS